MTALSGLGDDRAGLRARRSSSREGLGAHSAVLPESTTRRARGLPAAALGDRRRRADRRRRRRRRSSSGRRSSTSGSSWPRATAPRSSRSGRPAREQTRRAAQRALHDLTEPAASWATRSAHAERAILIWSGPGGGGGARVAETAHALGFEAKPGSGAFYLPATPNGRGVADGLVGRRGRERGRPGADRAAARRPATRPRRPERPRAGRARRDRSSPSSMFHGLAVGWADLVLPGTAMLERDGTLLNLEGRLQRLRRAAIPPVPDELAWIAELAGRFGVEVSPHAAVVFDEVSERCFGGIARRVVGEQAPLPAAARTRRRRLPTTTAPSGPDRADEHFLGELRLVRYRPLFSGPVRGAGRRAGVPAARGRDRARAATTPSGAEIANGDLVDVRSNGTSVRAARAHQPQADARRRPHRRGARRRAAPRPSRCSSVTGLS